MGCGCGGRRAASSGVNVAGQPVVWRLYHPPACTGCKAGTVDYWDRGRGEKARQALPGSRLVKTDPRTGKELPE